MKNINNFNLKFLVFTVMITNIILASVCWAKNASTNPIDLFDHDKHHSYFSNLNVSCEICHKTDDSYNREKVYKKGCHYCHNSGQSPSPKAANFKCITCHKDLNTIKPQDHEMDWISRHQTRAKMDKKYCYKCHKSFACSNCHQHRNTVDLNMHSRIFETFHSIEARSNPAKCSKCHTISFCKDCHAKNN